MSSIAGYPVVYAVLLAAGASHRVGKDNKLLIEIDGKPLVRRVAQRLLASRVQSVMARRSEVQIGGIARPVRTALVKVLSHTLCRYRVLNRTHLKLG